MSIRFNCQCGKQYRVKDEMAGRKAKCSQCGQAFTIPQASHASPDPNEIPFSEGNLAAAPPPPQAPEPPPAPSASRRTDFDDDRDAAATGTGTTGEALRYVLTDPMGGQGLALNMLGQTRAMVVGLAFIILFVAAMFFFADRMILTPLRSFAAAFGGEPQFGAGIYLRLLLACVTPPLCLVIVFTFLSKLVDGAATVQGAVFSIGVSLFPATIGAILIYLSVSQGWLRVSAAVSVASLCMTVLIMGAGLLTVARLSTRKVVILTPVMIIIAGFLSSLILSSVEDTQENTPPTQSPFQFDARTD